MNYHDLLNLNRIYIDTYLRGVYTIETKYAAKALVRPGCRRVIQILANGNLNYPEQVIIVAKTFS